MANDLGRRRRRLPAEPWTIAALVCLFGGAVLLVVAWYDISGTANLYEQMPYLVSAGFSGLALIIVGSALLIVARGERVERRLSQLVDAITEVADVSTTPAEIPAGTPDAGQPAQTDQTDESYRVAAGGTTYHRPECLLLRGKDTTAADAEAIASGKLTPCPVCDP
jgi:hypothetical protein